METFQTEIGEKQCKFRQDLSCVCQISVVGRLRKNMKYQEKFAHLAVFNLKLTMFIKDRIFHISDIDTLSTGKK